MLYSKPSLMNLTRNIQHYGHFTQPQKLFSIIKKCLFMALFHCMVRHGTVRYGSLLGGSLSSCYETSRRILRYGNSFPSTFPEVLLAHASPNDWPIVAKHANMTSSRQYKCDARDNYIRIFYFTC